MPFIISSGQTEGRHSLATVPDKWFYNWPFAGGVDDEEGATRLDSTLRLQSGHFRSLGDLLSVSYGPSWLCFE